MLGFLQICAGVVLLQLSKSAKDVPDTAVFKGDLDQVRTVAEQEEPESEPKADAIRGTAAIIRRISMSRQKLEAEEARRVHEERLRDQMEPIAENERVEWDGLRRRKTIIDTPDGYLERRQTLHPPLGMAYFPNEENELNGHSHAGDDDEQAAFDGGFMNSLKKRARISFLPQQRRNDGFGQPEARSPMYPVPLTEVRLPQGDSDAAQHMRQSDGSCDTPHTFGLPSNPRDVRSNAASRLAPPVPQSQNSLAPTPPPHSARRQFSFQNVFRRKSDVRPDSRQSFLPVPRSGGGYRHGIKGQGTKSGTEEEQLGLVKGDSTHMLPPPEYVSDEEDWQLEREKRRQSPTRPDEKHVSDENEKRQSWPDAGKYSPELRNLITGVRTSNDHEEPDRRRPMEREDRTGDGGGGGPAFV